MRPSTFYAQGVKYLQISGQPQKKPQLFSCGFRNSKFQSVLLNHHFCLINNIFLKKLQYVDTTI